jgi:hypothetical protein
MRALLLFTMVLAAAGCLRTTEFKCATDSECGTNGACESTGYCSFVDQDCASGRRYGDFSGTYSQKCVGDSMLPDGGMPDGGMSDTPQPSCPATYTTLPNAGTHVYKLTVNAATWSTQRARCMDDGAYLAVPGDAAELQAITTAAAAARTWVGITDQVTEGTYVTVQGTTATFLPWDTANGEPDNPGGMGGEDCVSALMASQKLATDRCSLTFPAVCECEP